MTTPQEALEHRDAMLDVFTEITQDCLLLGLKPVHITLAGYSSFFQVSVQFVDVESVDKLAGSWSLKPDDGSTNYTRHGSLDVGGRDVLVTAYTGRPTRKLPAHPVGYAPRAVEA